MDQKGRRKGYTKIYDLSKRYSFLELHFPQYLFSDPQGRGLLQAVPNSFCSKIHNPCLKLQELSQQRVDQKDSIVNLVKAFTKQLINYTEIPSEVVGVTGSILVGLQTEQSDIDIVIYGRKNGLKVYQIMETLFQETIMNRYTIEELKNLWKNRGQKNQLSFDNFKKIELDKQLQGTFRGTEFYIRLVPFLGENKEKYDQTLIRSAGMVELEATVSDNSNSIFTPAIYELTDIRIINSNQPFDEFSLKRLYSHRGRYCELVKKGAQVRIKGKLEEIKIGTKPSFFQVYLGTNKEEFFVKKE
jgi:hypothetical protein